MKILICKFQIAGLSWLIAISIGCISAEARGDGGTLQLSQRCGGWQVSVFTSPAVPRVGPVDVSVLVQDATTHEICDDVMVKARLEQVDAEIISTEQQATTAAATNRLFKAAQFDVPKAGRWHVAVILPEMSEADSIGFDLEIAPPLPPWLQLAPWIGWPFAVVALFLVHQRLAVTQHGRRAAAR